MKTIKECLIDCLKSNKKEMYVRDIVEWVREKYPEKETGKHFYTTLSWTLISNSKNHKSSKTNNPSFYVNNSESPFKFGLLIWDKDSENNNKDEEYIVYIRKMKVTNKFYIGITKDTMEERAGGTGEGYKYNKEFNHDIRLYGWTNVESKILEKGLTKKEAEEKEHEWIAYFDTTNPNKGYNKRK